MEKHKGSVAEDYGRQTRAVVVFALFGGVSVLAILLFHDRAKPLLIARPKLTALGTVATGLWFVLYVKDFVVIVEVYVSGIYFCTQHRFISINPCR